MRRILSALMAIAITTVVILVASAPASAAIVESDRAYLLDSGATTHNASADWRFSVECSQFLALDAKSWDFEIYGGGTINTSGSVTAGAHIATITEGGSHIMRSVTSTIIISLSGRVYGNIS